MGIFLNIHHKLRKMNTYFSGYILTKEGIDSMSKEKLVRIHMVVSVNNTVPVTVPVSDRTGKLTLIGRKQKYNTLQYVMKTPSGDDISGPVNIPETECIYAIVFHPTRNIFVCAGFKNIYVFYYHFDDSGMPVFTYDLSLKSDICKLISKRAHLRILIVRSMTFESNNILHIDYECNRIIERYTFDRL